MRRKPIESSVIASMGYDPERCELGYWATGDVYRYFDVPLDEYQAFMAAESKGEYLNKVFKPREYRYEIILHGRERAG